MHGKFTPLAPPPEYASDRKCRLEVGAVIQYKCKGEGQERKLDWNPQTGKDPIYSLAQGRVADPDLEYENSRIWIQFQFKHPEPNSLKRTSYLM